MVMPKPTKLPELSELVTFAELYSAERKKYSDLQRAHSKLQKEFDKLRKEKDFLLDQIKCNPVKKAKKKYRCAGQSEESINRNTKKQLCGSPKCCVYADHS